MVFETENWSELYEGTNSPEFVRCKVCGERVFHFNKFKHAQKHVIRKRVETIIITGPNVWGLPVGAKKEIEVSIYGKR